MQDTQAIFELLFKRNFSDPGNKQFLEQLTLTHPYFTPAQFYLLQHTKDGSEPHKNQAAKTSLLFNNPYWLNFQLQQTKYAIPIKEEYIAVKEEETVVAEPVEEMQPVIEPIKEEVIFEEAVQEVEVDIEPIKEEEVVVKEPVEEINAHIEPIKEEEEVIIEEPVQEMQVDINPIKEEEEIIIEEPVDEINAHIEPIKEEEEEVIIEEPVQEMQVDIEPIKEEVIVEEPVEEMHAHIEPIKEEKPVVEAAKELPVENDGEEESLEEKEIAPMKIELKLPAEKNALDELPLFEPMHMVDYFASQGIKLNEAAQAGDKLGRQLKSFTEWLKTMKKVHVEQGPATEQTDNSVQVQAEKSNAEDEVLTVSMADVLARQGKIDKAREVLEKLSLLNPAKSAYFAAKIEHLKEL